MCYFANLQQKYIVNLTTSWGVKNEEDVGLGVVLKII